MSHDCPKCGQPMKLIEDEDTGEKWYYCNNPKCGNLEHYDVEAK